MDNRAVRCSDQRVELPGHRTLVLRKESPGDAGGLVALYDRLDADELYCRFFSGCRPPDSFVERMTHVSERGGLGLVAVLIERAGVALIVGEVSYELLGDGDGELGITIDRRARGWLGPWMLDAIIRQARARGVRNIQAEVLLSNRPMLALLRSRGFVTLERYFSPATARVAVGAAQSTPVWSGPHDQVRVLVEAPGGAWLPAGMLKEHGFKVMMCPGPLAGGPPCPALAGRPCPLVADADVVVAALPRSEEPGSQLLDLHRLLHPSIPVCVPAQAGEEPPEDLPTLSIGDPSGVRSLLTELASGCVNLPPAVSKNRP
jgi:GNAT superfamily N-acetyltransferase